MTSPHPHHLFHPAEVGGYVDSMRLGLDHLADALRTASGPATGQSPARAARLVGEVDLDRPLGDPAAALEEVRRVWLDDAVWFHEPAYAAHLNCPVVVPALLAELFVSGVNASLDTFDQSVGATYVERHLVSWTAGRIGLGDAADGVFTGGGTQSNLQALLLAREEALGRHPGTTPAELRILASHDAHFSVQTSARLLGLPEDAVVPVATDRDRRMDPAALHSALAEVKAAGLVPAAVVATAGTTDFGAVDPLPEVADLCRQHGAWLHVDAAYGGGLLASARLRHRLDGIERADSVTVDFHKTWFQPVSCSALLVRDGQTLRHVRWHADYLNPAACERPNQVDKSLQTTRRFDALKLWLTLRVMGADTIGAYVEHVVDLADEVHRAVLDHPGLEVAAAPQLSTLVLRPRFRHASGGDADGLVDATRAELYAQGRAMVAATTVDGRRWLKLTLLNPRATAAEILEITRRVAVVGRELEAELLVGAVAS